MTSIVISIDKPTLRKVKKWGDPIMVAAGFDVKQVNTSNFQAVPTFAKGSGLGGVTSFLNIPRAEVLKLRDMQVPDQYTDQQKMQWLCSFRGSIYMYENASDSWETSPSIRWGTIAIGGNLVQVEGYEQIASGGRTYNMARLKGFRRDDWNRPLNDLMAEGLVHRCYCAYLPNNGFGDSPKGIVYSPFFSPMDYDFAGNIQPTHLYIPTEWLEE